MTHSWSTSLAIADATIPNIYKAAKVAVVLISDPVPGSGDDPIHDTHGPYLVHIKGISWDAESERGFVVGFLRYVADELERNGEVQEEVLGSEI